MTLKSKFQLLAALAAAGLLSNAFRAQSVSFACLALLLVFSLTIPRSLLSRLKFLAGEMKPVAQDRDDAPMGVVGGSDELDAVTAGFHEMRRRIQQCDHELRQLRQQLESEVVRRTAELTAAISRMEAAYADTERFLSCVPSILIGLDPSGRITRWNSTAASTFGVDAERAMGRTLDGCGIKWLHANMKEEVHHWLEASSPSHRSEDIRYEKDQKVRFLGLHILRISSQDQTTGFLITGADVTERRTLERELRQAQRLEAVGQLAAGIAHEINTPIQYVGDNIRFIRDAFGEREEVLTRYEQVRQAAQTGEVPQEMLAALAQAIEDADLDYLNQEIPKAVAQSLDGIERVASIVRAIKEFAHPGRKAKAAADINRALESALIVARNEIKYVADVETDFGGVPLVICQIAEMGQVFLNLLVNAAHAIAEVVKDTEKKGKITVRTWQAGDHVVIAISDTGCGIPTPIQTRVFDPFFTTKPVGRGTGQGLAIARSIVVKKHGGSLTFEPNGSQGTTFLISLPIEPVPTTPVIG